MCDVQKRRSHPIAALFLFSASVNGIYGHLHVQFIWHLLLLNKQLLTI